MSMYPGGGYPPPPPPPYANAAYGPYTAAPRNGMGTTALVLGIVGLLTSWSVVGGLLFGLGAVACGVIGRNRVKEGLADNAVVAGAGVEEAAARALTTVRQVMPTRLRARVDALPLTAVPRGGGPTVDTESLLALGAAIRAREEVRFDYHHSDHDGHDDHGGADDRPGAAAPGVDGGRRRRLGR